MSERLEDIAKAMVAPGQGILAADESNSTMQKRFDTIGAENTEANRRAYREMLFTSDDAMSNYISGVILFDETIHQKCEDGTRFVDKIKAQGAVPGIKVDEGVKDLDGCPGETVTQGLDGLADRLKGYYEEGARFAKWRAVITITDTLPTAKGIQANAEALAKYAKACQEAGIVPIVEPEVQGDADPADHSLERCEEVTAEVLRVTFEELAKHDVNLAGIVLKPSMVLPGRNAPKADPKDVAAATLRVLKATVPAEVPGIAFLSGGQSDREATKHLSLMNEMGGGPWTLTFSYGRALQDPPRAAWKGDKANLPAAAKAFLHRAKMNGLAAKGEYRDEMEGEAA